MCYFGFCYPGSQLMKTKLAYHSLVLLSCMKFRKTREMDVEMWKGVVLGTVTVFAGTLPGDRAAVKARRLPYPRVPTALRVCGPTLVVCYVYRWRRWL